MRQEQQDVWVDSRSKHLPPTFGDWVVQDRDLDQYRDLDQRTKLVFGSRTRRTDQGNGVWTTARWVAGS